MQPIDRVRRPSAASKPPTTMGQQSSRPECVHGAIGVSHTVLTTLQSAAAFAPIPYLQQAAIVALSILNSVQGARGNKIDFAVLASDACGLVYSIDAFVKEKEKEGRELPSDLINNLRDLFTRLQEVEVFVQKRRGFLKRFVMSTTDAARIAGYRAMLTQFLATVMLESHLSIRDSVAQIAKRQEEMLAALQQKGLDQTSRPHGHDFLSNPNVNAANSSFTTVSGNQTNSFVNNTATNTNSGNMSTFNYTGGGSIPRHHSSSEYPNIGRRT